jgi:hypothetical protein
VSLFFFRVEAQQITYFADVPDEITRSPASPDACPLRLKIVGRTMVPPLTIAAMAIPAWSGLTASPPPKEAARVSKPVHSFGMTGAVPSIPSNAGRSSWFIFSRKALWPAVPTLSARRAVAMFEEYRATSGKRADQSC